MIYRSLPRGLSAMGSFCIKWDAVMVDPELRSGAVAVVRTLRIIVLGLFVGGAVMLAVMGLLRGAGPKPEGGAAPSGWSKVVPGPITAVALGMSAFCLLAALFLPKLVIDSALIRAKSGSAGAVAARSSSAEPAAQTPIALYQTRTIIAGALLEGGANVASVTYFVEGSVACLIVGVVLLLVLLSLFPSVERFERWAEGLASA